MPLLKTKLYTIDDIYALPDGKRAELLDGRIYDMAPPSPLHQELVAVLTTSLQNYIAKKNMGTAKFIQRHLQCLSKRMILIMWNRILVWYVTIIKFQTVAVKERLTLLLKLFLQAVGKWIILQKMRFMQMQEFENTGLSIRLENALPYIVTKKMSRLLSFLLAIQLN